jgi:hypothetical protein
MAIIRTGGFGPIPASMLTAEIEGLYGTEVLQELRDIVGCYQAYEKGADFTPEGSNGDYVAAKLKFKQIRKLINKEAAFMFAKPLDFNVETVNEDDNETVKKEISIIQTFLNKVLKKNLFNSKILKGAKDCFIGKRVAIVLNFNEDSGISLSFSPSLEFVYETDETDADKLIKLVIFYTKKDSMEKTAQEIYKKKYWMQNGFCHVHEATYDGLGKMKEEIIKDLTTKFEYIPAVVIINEGLTGDTNGESDVSHITDTESWFSRLGSADIDSMRKGMNPIKYTVDMDSKSTENITTGPGAYWDLQTDDNKDEIESKVGILESDLAYSQSLKTTMERLKSQMHEELSVPDVSSEKLQGIIASGKSFTGIYWELIIRCEEKLTVWKPALEFIASTIIEGAKLYPECISRYTTEKKIPDTEYIMTVENNYPIPEDEEAEKQTDLAEVNAQTMSRKFYMKKWRQLTDKEANDELKQIALERQTLEDSFMPPVNEGNKEEELE